MRIRKNFKITVQNSSNSEITPLQAYICQLNQSPWDVDVSPLTNSSPLFQLQGNDSSWGNGECEDINGPLESFAKLSGDNSSVDEEEEEEKLEDFVNYCSKTDENRNWICGLEAKQGETFCEFHLRSYIALRNIVHPVTKKSSSKLGKKTGAKKPKTEENPYQSFSYYSGFGPNWGKKRATRETISKANEVAAKPSLSNGAKELSDFEDEEEDVIDNGTKRVRKRIKARSLKSLM